MGNTYMLNMTPIIVMSSDIKGQKTGFFVFLADNSNNYVYMSMKLQLVIALMTFDVCLRYEAKPTNRRVARVISVYIQG